MSWYRAGTISLTNGSVDVVGVGTAFTSEVRFSDILLINGALYEIARVVSDTALKLTTPYAGATVANVDFAIIRNLTNASNFDLMKKIEEFLTDRQRSMDEFVEWINGLPNSGPTSNGIFPLTDRYGVTVYCKSPKQMEADTLALTNRQADLISQTETTLTSVQATLTAIGDQQAWADQILGYKNAAAASATKASQWADNAENTAVETGKYSAKHHALKAAASATGAATSATTATTKADEAAASATTASGKATDAATSATNAAASAATASTKATEAATSATNAATSASQAATSKAGADTAKTAAQTAETNAKTAETNAAASATASASSASAASLSANTAKDWAEKTTGAVTGTQYSAKYHAQLAQTARSDVESRQSDVMTRQSDVQTRQSDVITRQSNVATLESSALASKNAAAASATTASTKATEASNSATAASASATNAAASATTATTKASDASTSASNAAASATAAANSASAAATSKTSADAAKTAAEAARTGADAAKTAAEEARDRAELAASTLAGNLVEFGGIDLSGGVYPAAPATAGFWKVTVAGVVDGVGYGVGDTLVYSKNLGQFYKIDNTESVTSVAGKNGVVTLTKTDVGLSNVDNTSDADKPISTATQTALNAKAPLASPALTGTPTAPTPAAGTNTTQIATAAFVQAALAALVNGAPGALDQLNELAAAMGNDPNFATTMLNSLALKAPLESPALTGNPTAPTPAATDNDTSIATTAFVRAAMALFGLTDPATRQAWHAANLVKQTGPTDTTVGAMLAVGAANLLTATASEGFDVLKGSRFVRAGAGGPLGATICGGLSIGVTGTIEQQLAMRVGRAFFRSKGDTDSDWRELFHTGNLLGTVSQSGGVPTGAAFQSVVNANGRALIFPDGTAICYKFVTASFGAAAYLDSGYSDWPINFSSASELSVSHSLSTVPSGMSGQNVGYCRLDKSATTIRAYVYATAGAPGWVSGNTMEVRLVAMGKVAI